MRNRLRSIRLFIPGVFALVVISVFMNTKAASQPIPPDSTIRTVSIQSEPDSAQIYINNILRGVTPIRWKVACQKPVTMRLAKDGYLSRTDTLPVSTCADTALMLRLRRPATLIVHSNPESANVFIGNKYSGVTPLVLSDIPPDSQFIRVTKQFYTSWSMALFAAEGSRTELSALLSERPATMNVLLSPASASVFLDDKFIAKGSVVNTPVTVGTHKLAVHDDSTGRAAETILNISKTAALTYRAELGARSAPRALLAIVIPGSAQLLDRSYLKGSLFLVGSIALGANALMAQNEYRDRLDQYDRAMDRYVAAPTETEASRLHEDLDARKSDLNTSYTYRNLSLAAFVAGYLFSVVDAYVNHLTEDRLDLAPLYQLQAAQAGPASPRLIAGVGLKVGL